MTFTPIDVPVYILAFQSFTVSLYLLFTNSGQKLGNRLFSFFFMIIFLRIVFYYARGIDPFMGRISYALAFLYGPIVWLYIKCLTGKSKLQKSDAYHLAPVILAFVFFELIRDQYELSELLIALSFSSYTLFAYSDVRSFVRKNKAFEANLRYLLTGWLKITLFACFAIAFFSLLTSMFQFWNNFKLVQVGFLAQTTTWLIVVNIFIYHGIPSLDDLMEDKTSKKEVDNKYKSSPLSEEEIEYYSNEILKLLESDKIYQDPTVSLTHIAERISLTTKSTSQVVNEGLETNFSDLINSYRLKHAQNLLVTKNNQEMNITQILYEAGFNSKTSFYNYFKRKTGTSPKDYRARYLTDH
ncbi:helix-turn-helix domain-containing protein [Muricauda sp. JGD-17]|uniref:Helix-turn-helix domain-containing protein n=1 Tax=Flagellimonas ochracea TaxID=2696472 RepID=A0A964WYM1_9FLAO|nr:helix-turn-helix domain-containing protein [Allomuricauda ochracea]NAY93340.1 helix-turn-helix domain-containing protein [Allomuricauda ochracea]